MRLVSRHGVVRSLLLPFVLVAALCVALIQPGATAQAASLGTAGLFVPVQGRLVSTLAGTGTTKAPLAANTPRTIQATGAAGVPATGVAAVLVTFTVVDPTSAGQASVGAAGEGLSGAMRYVAGEPTSNSAVVQLSSSGQFQIQTTTQTNANIDIQGYYTSGSGTAAGGYVPLDYIRTVNTDTGLGLPQATLAGGSTSTIQVSGTAGVPAGAAAVFVNFEVQNQNTTSGNITAYSASASRPTSTLQFGVGKTSLGTIVPLDADGKIKVFVSAGNTIDLIMDVEGYFTPGSADSSAGSIFTPKAAKIYDTRSKTTVAAGASVTVPVGGQNGIPTVEQGLSAITANITAINKTTIPTGSYARVYPSRHAEPQGVGITFNSGPAGTASTNLATVAVGGDDAIVIHNVSSVAVDYILDLEGWYTTSNPDPTPPVLSPGPSGDMDAVKAAAAELSSASPAQAPSAVAKLADAASNQDAVPLQDFGAGAVTASTGADTTATVSTSDGSAVMTAPDDTAMPSVGIAPAGDADTINVVDGSVVSSGVAKSTDVVSRATDVGVQLVAILQDASAPKTVPFDLNVPQGSELVAQSDGSYVITAPVTEQVVPDSELERVSAATDDVLGDAPDDQPVTDAQQTALDAIPEAKTVPVTTVQDVATLQAPWAVDANGNSVPTHYTITGTTVAQIIDTTPTTAYPVTADPSVVWWVWTSINCVADIAGLIYAGSWALAHAVLKITNVLKKSARLASLVHKLGGAKNVLKVIYNAARGLAKGQISKYLSHTQLVALIGLGKGGMSVLADILNVGSCYSLLKASLHW